jgi:tetratricopeptide (TPR) repeat protein
MFKLKGFLITLLILCFAFAAYAQGNRGGTYFDLGVYAFEDKNFADAEMNFKKALEFSPDDPLYNYYLGKTYLGMETYDLAETYLLSAQKIDPDLVGLQYDIGALYYKTGQFSQAVEYYKKVLQEEPHNILAQYHCGISLYKQQKYEEALFYFISASGMSPTIKMNGYYWAGISSMKMGDYDKAIERLTYVRENSESESLKSHAVKGLNAIEKQKKRLKPYSLLFRMGYAYDSNIVLEPVDEDFVTDADDSLVTLYFSGSYNLVNKSQYVLGAGYNHYQTLHSQLKEYDLTGSIGNIYSRFITGPLTFSLSYLPHYYWLDNDDYLRRHQILPDIIWRVKNNLVARISYSYFDNDYFKDESRNGETHEPILSGYYFFGRQKGYLYGRLGYENNDAISPDQDYDKVSVQGGLSYGLPWKLKLGLNGRYDEKNYENVDSTYKVEREDDKYFGAITLSRTIFFDWLILTGEYNYTKNNSNISVYEYRRHVGTLHLSARF